MFCLLLYNNDSHNYIYMCVCVYTYTYIYIYIHTHTHIHWVAQKVQNLPTMRETGVQSLVWEDPLEKGMTTHTSILAQRIPWTGRLVGYSPWSHKESDVTKQLTHTHILSLQSPPPHSHHTSPGHHKTSDWPSVLYISFPLVTCFIHDRVLSQFL